MEKRHGRKRDWFWHLLGHKRHDERKKSEDQQGKITFLSNYAKQYFSLELDCDIFESLLEDNEWDTKRALADLSDYEEASHGILIEPPPIKQVILGAENDGGTSCYIDALLFAMYISNTTFDPLLTYDIPNDETKVKLQTVMRLFINKMRKGHFISASYVHWFRKVLEEANWHGKDDDGHWAQEDTSELFMFITETFDLPYLPFQIRLFHGANHDMDDDRVMTDRTLSLSIPESELERLRLEDMLLDYFYNNVITGIRREIDNTDILENVASSPTFAHEKKTLIASNVEREVIAWQVLELLPFYSAINEQGESIQTQLDSSFPDTHMILPIVLKRYKYEDGQMKKNKQMIDIPSSIDFNRFINQNVDDPLCPTCGHMVDWTLYLKSAVCHKGSSPYSGHYIAYSRQVDNWIKFDDMNKENRVSLIKEETKMFADLAENAYIIFYELDKTCHHNDRQPSKDTLNNHHHSCILM
ncbi:hypothetical protein RO3G_04417 [Rhizopus delemar RA 99-880]|uniref:ubiquitinyl hydrolase 1 n=3 Tax=Rhizopus TaxID=4842 RepID=I1BU32_RHIO9|nr:hypothetical protein RO3G_04417 [Rhizopus delemar RA 99-880]|eukprot:EIE79712.1 hypothetical protein RO3G_04417 [Rhizopus delemar RA 99-880]